jgi:quercetin dioxygenase-like cupin family protein
MFKLSRRDLIVALFAIAGTCCVTVFAQSKLPLMKSSVFDWNSIQAQKTDKGATRKFFDGSTGTLDELECHVTTLNPGVMSHPPHQHANEEMIIVKEGTVEALVDGELKRVGAGSIIFQAPNKLHSIKNVGETPATYYAIKWLSPGMLESKAKE